MHQARSMECREVSGFKANTTLITDLAWNMLVSLVACWILDLPSLACSGFISFQPEAGEEDEEEEEVTTDPATSSSDTLDRAGHPGFSSGSPEREVPPHILRPGLRGRGGGDGGRAAREEQAGGRGHFREAEPDPSSGLQRELRLIDEELRSLDRECRSIMRARWLQPPWDPERLDRDSSSAYHTAESSWSTPLAARRTVESSPRARGPPARAAVPTSRRARGATGATRSWSSSLWLHVGTSGG